MDSVNSYIQTTLNGPGPLNGYSEQAIQALKNQLFGAVRGQTDRSIADANSSLSARGLGRSQSLKADAILNAGQQGAGAYSTGMASLLADIEGKKQQADMGNVQARQQAVQNALSLIGMRPQGGPRGPADDVFSLPTLPGEPGF